MASFETLGVDIQALSNKDVEFFAYLTTPLLTQAI